MATIAWCDTITNSSTGATADNTGSMALNVGGSTSLFAKVVGAYTTLDWTWIWDATTPGSSNNPVWSGAPGALHFEFVTFSEAVRAGTARITALVDGVQSNSIYVTFDGAGNAYWGSMLGNGGAVGANTLGWKSPNASYVSANPAVTGNASGGGIDFTSIYGGVVGHNYSTAVYTTEWIPAAAEPTIVFFLGETYADVYVLTRAISAGEAGTLRITAVIDGVPAINRLVVVLGSGETLNWYAEPVRADFWTEFERCHEVP